MGSLSALAAGILTWSSQLGDLFPTFRRLRRPVWILPPLLAVGALILWLAFFVDWRRHTIVVDGVAREYLLYVPSSRDAELKPLVLAYHGFSGNAAGMAKDSELHELVDERDFYLAYLEGDTTWQFFAPDDSGASRDVVFFDRLCDELIRSYPIDPRRVYVVGMSRGGDFAVYLAQRRSARIAAVVSQGACMLEAVETERPFPLMVIVGTEDDRVPPDWFPSLPQAFRDRGHVVEVLRPENVGQVMCRTLVSVDWQGFLYDCDFNQMLGLHLHEAGQRHGRLHLDDWLEMDLDDNPIVVADHCYGCTAGQGSSCGGALA